ncbi:MAG: DegV family protein [Eubacteriales bacterium]|nr:DegV family protein [Eubacteriales bacterium]
MSEYVITCCSTADMSRQFMEDNKIPFAMFHYQLDGKEFEDDLYTSITPEAFYKKISDGAQPVTSQINVEGYISLFEPILKQGRDVLHLTLSSGISGSINSANIARAQLLEDYPDRRIAVVDSLAASSGYGLLVTQALENQRAGMSLEENVSWLEANRNKLHHWFFSTDLTSYIRGGRVSKTAGFVGRVLNICPLLNVNSEGKLIPRSKIRGKKQVIAEIVKRMEEHARDGHDYSGKCYISQSACLEDAKQVARLVEEKFPGLDGKVLINNIGTVIGSHTGPGTVALFFWGDERTL